MSDWDMPTYPTMALRDDAGWQPVGGAFAASAAVHAFAIALIATMLVHAPAAATIRAGAAAAPGRAGESASPPSRARHRARRATARAGARARCDGDPVQAPWTAEPFDPSPPQWLHSRPMISEGVVMFEMRNVSMLGETIERMIQANYAGEPQFPVLLKPVEELGYPLDVLEAGVEGRGARVVRRRRGRQGRRPRGAGRSARAGRLGDRAPRSPRRQARAQRRHAGARVGGAGHRVLARCREDGARAARRRRGAPRPRGAPREGAGGLRRYP
jgi:hypothetical protein